MHSPKCRGSLNMQTSSTGERLESKVKPVLQHRWSEQSVMLQEDRQAAARKTEIWVLDFFFFPMWFTTSHQMASKNQQTSGYFKPPQSGEVFAVSSRRRSSSTRSRAEFYIQTQGWYLSKQWPRHRKKKVLSGSAVIHIFTNLTNSVGRKDLPWK